LPFFAFLFCLPASCLACFFCLLRKARSKKQLLRKKGKAKQKGKKRVATTLHKKSRLAKQNYELAFFIRK
jgi:hypothetical protein